MLKMVGVVIILLLDFNNGFIIQYFAGNTFPITFKTNCMVVFDDGAASHVGSYYPIPNGYRNCGCIAIGI